jgi:putative polyketide hydroxylase
LNSSASAHVLATPVLVVGAGPVGMMTALLLARQGVRSIVIERRRDLASHPKGRGFNARSMELFRQCGMLPDMLAAQPKTHEVQHVAIGARIDDPALKIMPFFGAEQSVRNLSPAPNVVGGQDILEMVVVSHLRRIGAVELIYDCELTALEQNASGVRAQARRSDGSTLRFAAQYVVAADGARSPLRKLCGREMQQCSPVLNQNVNILFRADLSAYLPKFSTCAFLTIVSAKPPGLRGILAIMPTVRSPHERTYNVVLRPDESPDAIGIANAADWIRNEVGLPHDLAIEVQSVSPWDATARLLDQFRAGRVFFAGDAARTIPPAGALGMNTGLIDANNLAWRLAFAVQGLASERLLDDYASERRAHSEAIVAASLDNMRGAIAGGPPRPSGAPSAAAAGVAPPAGAAPRAPPESRSQMGLYFGFVYRSGSVIDDGAALPQPADPRNDYVPTATPGARAPHLWIDPRYEQSILDLLGGGFVLLAADHNAWLLAAEKLAFATRLPLKLVNVRTEARTEDIWRAWLELYAVTPIGAVLVRPDGIVAWRSDGAGQGDAFATLHEVFVKLLGRDVLASRAMQAGGSND